MVKKAFTLAEVLSTLLILGVLAAILIPTIVKIKPNSSKSMFKKAYYIAERVLSEIVNDETYYPEEDTTIPNLVNEDAVKTSLGEEVSGNEKFCLLFADKVNTTDSVDCTTTTIASGTTDLNSGNFTTADGITWHLPVTPVGSETTVFTNPNATPAPALNSYLRSIIVDINGTSEKTTASPNCLYDATTCPNPDQFEIKVYYNGKILIDGIKEKEYLKTTSLR